MQYKILIFQNNKADDLVTYLKAKGFLIIEATAEDVTEKIRERTFDLAILDGLEPDRYKLVEVLRRINNRIGIIFITAEPTPGDMIDALNAGADVYFNKPYDLVSMPAQIGALIRKTGMQRMPDVYNIGNYVLNPATRELTIGDFTVKIPPKDMKLLCMLCDHEEQLLPKDAILRTVWQEDNFFNGRCMDVAITHLRNYLKFDPKVRIENVRGKGFIFHTK